MRKIILLLLLLLLFTLTYIVSCGKKPSEQAASSPATTTDTDVPTETLSEKANTSLKAAGFGDITPQEVDGRLVLTGSVNSPAERVRAGRSLDNLGVEVINHIRTVAAPASTAAQGQANPVAVKTQSPKPLSLLLRRGPSGTVATGYLSEALVKTLEEGFNLAPTSKLETGRITTRSAETAVQLAKATVRQLKNGSVRLQGSQMVVNGQIMSDPDAFKAALQRRLPAGYTLAARVTKATAQQMASAPVAPPIVSPATRRPAAAKPATPRPIVKPVATKPVTKPIAASEAAPVYKPVAMPKPKSRPTPTSQLPIAKTLPVDSKPIAQTNTRKKPAQKPTQQRVQAAPTNQQPAISHRPVSDSINGHNLADLPLAKTYTIDGTEQALKAYTFADTSPQIATPIAQPATKQAIEINQAAKETASEPFSGNCSTANLMPKGTIRFFHNSAKLTSSSRQRLEIALPIIRRCEQRSVAIVGHTDLTGDRKANMDISRARAERIYQYLLDNGIERDRLQVSAKGGSEPQLSNDSKFGRAINRRVEISLR